MNLDFCSPVDATSCASTVKLCLDKYDCKYLATSCSLPVIDSISTRSRCSVSNWSSLRFFSARSNGCWGICGGVVQRTAVVKARSKPSSHWTVSIFHRREASGRVRTWRQSMVVHQYSISCCSTASPARSTDVPSGAMKWRERVATSTGSVGPTLDQEWKGRKPRPRKF